MATHHDILIRIFTSFDYSNYIMIFNRTHLEMVPDIKFKLKISAFLNHLFNNLVLMLVKLYVRNCRKCLKSHFFYIFPII